MRSVMTSEHDDGPNTGNAKYVDLTNMNDTTQSVTITISFSSCTRSYVQTPVAHGNIWFLRIWMYQCQFMAPSTTTSSLLPPWWIAPHTMTDGPRFPSLGSTQASISLSPCLRRTRILLGRTGTHHWSVSIVWGPTLCVSFPTNGDVACAPKWT